METRFESEKRRESQVKLHVGGQRGKRLVGSYSSHREVHLLYDISHNPSLNKARDESVLTFET